MNSVSSLKSLLLIVKDIVKGGGEFIDVGRRIWEELNKTYISDYSDKNPTIISNALHRMHTGSPPRIALIGMTSAGKSSLINALFGRSIAEVKRTPDTTDCIIEAKFPSNLVIYDTPGLAGDEGLGYENITRLFLDLPQEEEITTFSRVRYQTKPNNIYELNPEDLRRFYPLDAVIFAVDISRTLTRPEKTAYKAFFLEIQNKFDGRVVVAGTHLDVLKKLSEEELQGQLDSYNKIFGNQLIPISSISGEGLSDLVFALFRSMPGNVSLVELQKSLVSTRKLSRLSFAITEISGILTEIILLQGDKIEEIKAGYLGIFALICNHYSVDEATWLKCNGDALKISEEAMNVGTRCFKYYRVPKNLFEFIMSVFTGGIYVERVEYSSLGVNGLKMLLPKIYKTLHELSEVPGSEFSEREIQDYIDSESDKFEPLIERKMLEELTSQLAAFITELFPSYV